MRDPESWRYDSGLGILSVPDGQGRVLKIQVSRELRERLAVEGVSEAEMRALLLPEAETEVSRVLDLLTRVGDQVERIRSRSGDVRPGGFFHDEVSVLSRIVREAARSPEGR